MLMREEVLSLIEYERNKLLVHICPKDLLVIHDWRSVRLIVEPSPGNVSKFLLMKMPTFNVETFPFLICSGRQSLNLVNIKEFSIKILVKAPVWTDGPQQAIFFIPNEQDGYNLNFASRKITRTNKNQYDWHCMPLRNDFFELLRTYQQLPIDSPKEALMKIEELK